MRVSKPVLMTTETCESHRMTCTSLLHASVDNSGPHGMTCRTGDDEPGPGVVGWSTCKDETTSHFLLTPPALPAPKTKAQDKKQNGASYRRPYNRPEPLPVKKIPFKHHLDTSMYMKDYTKHESFTMGQDTDFVVKYELVGPSREMFTRWRDQFHTLGVRGEGVHDSTEHHRHGFSYTHSVSEKSTTSPLQNNKVEDTKQRQNAKPAQQSQTHAAPQRGEHPPLANYRFVVNVPKLIPDIRRDSDDTTRGTSHQPRDIASEDTPPASVRRKEVSKRDQYDEGAAHVLYKYYDTGTEEKFVREIEQEFRDSLSQSERTTRHLVPSEGPRHGTVTTKGQDLRVFGERNHLQLNGKPIQQPRQRVPLDVKRVSALDHTESEPYEEQEHQIEQQFQPNSDATFVPHAEEKVGKRTTSEHDSTVLKLPPLQEHLDNIKNMERDNRESGASSENNTGPTRSTRDFKKGKAKGVGGKKFTIARQYMDLPSPTKRFARGDSESVVPDYSTASVHQSVPPLTTVIPNQSDSPRLKKSKRQMGGSGSEIVLPKLQKWLSEGAVHKAHWEADLEDTSRTSRSQNPSHRIFSQEFLEYANQLRNREVISLLYDGAQIKHQRSPEPLSERETQSLPETEHLISLPNNKSQSRTNRTPRDLEPLDHGRSQNGLTPGTQQTNSPRLPVADIPLPEIPTHDNTPRYKPPVESKSVPKRSQHSNQFQHSNHDSGISVPQFKVVTSDDTGPPPNTPDNIYYEQQVMTVRESQFGTTTAMPAPLANHGARLHKRHGPQITVPRVNIQPEPEHMVIQTNEHIVEVVDSSLPAMARSKGSKKCMSSSYPQGKAVWR